MTRPPARTLLAVGALAGLLVLTACGSDDESSAGSTSTRSTAAGTSSAGPSSAGGSAGSGDSAASSGDDVCGELTDQGVTGASWGPVQSYLPKADLLAEVDARLGPMQAVTPPAEVADAWAAQQGWLEALKAAAEPLPEGGRISDPALVSPGDDVAAGQQTLTDWWFATCQ